MPQSLDDDKMTVIMQTRFWPCDAATVVVDDVDDLVDDSHRLGKDKSRLSGR